MPKTWPNTPWEKADVCGPPTPAVLLGPLPKSLVGTLCPARTSGAAVVNMGGIHLNPQGRLAKKTTDINGLLVHLAYSKPFRVDAPGPKPIVEEIVAYVPARQLWISIEVGTSDKLPGGAPGRATQIARTIRTA